MYKITIFLHNRVFHKLSTTQELANIANFVLAVQVLKWIQDQWNLHITILTILLFSLTSIFILTNIIWIHSNEVIRNFTKLAIMAIIANIVEFLENLECDQQSSDSCYMAPRGLELATSCQHSDNVMHTGRPHNRTDINCSVKLPCKVYFQWWILGDARDVKPPRSPNSFISMQFSLISWRTPWEIGVPTGNPQSATDFIFYWFSI